MAKILWHHFRFEASALAVERKRTFLKERRCIVGGNSVAKKASGKTESQCVRKGLHPMDLSLSRSLSVSLSLCDSLSFSMLSLSLCCHLAFCFFLGGFPAVGACGGVPAVDAWGGVSAVGPLKNVNI